MASLTPDQLRQLLRTAGFKANSQVEGSMVGIAYAESGGDPTKHNNKPPDDSYGIWQINMRGKLGPDRRKKFGIATNDKLFDPTVNAHAAYVVYQDQGLDAWTTYKNGAFLKYTDNMTKEEGGGGIPNPVTAIEGGISGAISSSLSGVASAIDSVGKNIFKGVASFIGIGVASVLLILGIVILVTQSNKAQEVVKVAKKVSKVVK